MFLCQKIFYLVTSGGSKNLPCWTFLGLEKSSMLGSKTFYVGVFWWLKNQMLIFLGLKPDPRSPTPDPTDPKHSTCEPPDPTPPRSSTPSPPTPNSWTPDLRYPTPFPSSSYCSSSLSLSPALSCIRFSVSLNTSSDTNSKQILYGSTWYDVGFHREGTPPMPTIFKFCFVCNCSCCPLSQVTFFTNKKGLG